MPKSYLKYYFTISYYSIIVYIRGCASWFWIDGFEQTKRIMNENPIVLQIIRFVISHRYRKAMWSQGIGRHTRDEFMEMMLGDLRSISDIMGKNKFLLGDEVCEEDFVIFAMLANCLWAIPGSPYEKLMTGNDVIFNYVQVSIILRLHNYK